MLGLSLSGRARVATAGLVVLGALVGVGRLVWPAGAHAPVPPAAVSAPVVSAPTATAMPKQAPPKLVVRPAPHDLPVIDYEHVPGGFPVDPESSSTARLTEGLHVTAKVAVYDGPGGRPRAFLPPAISGVEVTVPVVDRRPGWVAVLLPSVDRTIGWLPDRPMWTVEHLRDQLVLRRDRHELTWLRDGVRKGSWTVATGAAATPTPLGRTFVLGRTGTHGTVYAGLDAIVLGSVPERREALAPSLRGGHTAIHSWYRAAVFGRSVSNGCIRVPRDAQRTLLDQIPPGTPVAVVR